MLQFCNAQTPLQLLTEFMEIAKSPDVEDLGNLIRMKNLFMRDLVQAQTRSTGRFELQTDNIESLCTRCKGTGELYKFTRRPVTEDCTLCDEDGIQSYVCNRCDENGRFRVSRGPGLTVDVVCKFCKGEKTVTRKCTRCDGTKKFKRYVLESIMSTTPCPACGQLGFLPEAFNPVLDGDVASAIDGSL